MSQRERAAAGEAEAVARPAGGRVAPARPEAAPGARPHRPPAWEELYQAIPSDQQHELFSLAERQGVLYAHQLPAVSNGSDNDPNRQLFARLVAGSVTDLRPLSAPPVPVDDTELDAAQREAVSKALTTPDLLLVQGRSGTEKARVVAEIITRAAARGERVLLLAPTTAALDRVLERVASADGVFPVRCVDREENPAALPPAIRALTFPE